MTTAESNLEPYRAGGSNRRKQAPLPGLPRLGVAGIAVAAMGYFLFLVNSAVVRPGRAPLVRALDTAANASAGVMYAITALVVIFGVAVVVLSLGKPED